MRLDRERRRTVAQFLNSLAVGTVATLVLAPIAGGTVRPDLAIGAVAVATCCLLVAMWLGGRAG